MEKSEMEAAGEEAQGTRRGIGSGRPEFPPLVLRLLKQGDLRRIQQSRGHLCGGR
jgi:hypothetical protein